MDSQNSQSVQADESNREKMSVKYVQDAIGYNTAVKCFNCGNCLYCYCQSIANDYAGRIAKSFLKESEVVKA